MHIKELKRIQKKIRNLPKLCDEIEEKEETNPLKSSIFSIVDPVSASSESLDSMLKSC